MDHKVVVVTGASSSLGRLSAQALALAGHTVYASMRDTRGRNALHVEAVSSFADDNGVDLRTVEMDLQSQAEVNIAIQRVFDANGRIDAVVHSAGRAVFGPVEAVKPEQMLALFDVNVIGPQRVSRAALTHMRQQKQGLLVWISASSSPGGTPPGLAAYVASSAALDVLAVGYAHEVARWGVETVIIAPGTFTLSQCGRAESPADPAVTDQYETGSPAGPGSRRCQAFDATELLDSDVYAVADAIVNVVDCPLGRRPFRARINHAAPSLVVGEMFEQRSYPGRRATHTGYWGSSTQ